MATERWGIFELELQGPGNGNPFTDVTLSAQFRLNAKTCEPEGFYDGNGVYRIRFMPDEVGEWTYLTKSNSKALDGRTGSFICTEPSKGNHGPVRVGKTWHFHYADGTRYHPLGTTCYAWIHQGDKLEEQTLSTLKTSPFNKLRMCVFPKHYPFNENEPEYYCFERNQGQNDYTRFSPAFWRHLEKRVGQLCDMRIEADIIIFHPYDRWGYQSMDAKTDAFYLSYLVARLAAYRNVWWSFANEYDLMKDKQMSDWDRFFRIVREKDPYRRLRGIHNCRGWYDHSKSWVTHCSIQSSDFEHPIDWRGKYLKPIVYDECRYEGNIRHEWGNTTAEDMTHRFWLGTAQGAYVGHGETYMHPEDILWWSKGGALRGESPARIAFLKEIVEAAPFDEMTPEKLDNGHLMNSKPGEYYLVYFTGTQPVTLGLREGRAYTADVVDTWHMRITPLDDVRGGPYRFTPPRAGTALRIVVKTAGAD